MAENFTVIFNAQAAGSGQTAKWAAMTAATCKERPKTARVAVVSAESEAEAAEAVRNHFGNSLHTGVMEVTKTSNMVEEAV